MTEGGLAAYAEMLDYFVKLSASVVNESGSLSALTAVSLSDARGLRSAGSDATRCCDGNKDVKSVATEGFVLLNRRPVLN